MYNLLSKISLSSWDEAWYAEISKNILKTGEYYKTYFNGNPFFDHPPFVFWLQTISYRLFGINEFAVRFPSFLLGIGTAILLFFLGRKMFGKTVGFFAGLTLLTAPWFLSRSLTGNLDIVLTFLFLLTFYLTLKSSESKIFLIPLSISVSFLVLTKSLVPFTIFPAIIFLLWKKIKLKDLLVPFFIFALIVFPYFVINAISYPTFIKKYLAIGYPGANNNSNIIQNILLTKTYLHNGIGNIFLYGLFSLPLGLYFYKKKYLPFIIFISVFLIPFAFSDKGHIWHLLPIYPFWILAFHGLIESILFRHKVYKLFKFVIVFSIFLLISWTDVKRNWYEIIMAPSYVSDMEILSLKSKDFDYPLVLDDDSVPEVLFYSDKGRVERTSGRGDLAKRFATNNKFLLLTREWRLDEEKINPKEYNLISKDRDKVLILKN